MTSAPPPPRPHRRQFVLFPGQWPAPEGWLTHPLARYGAVHVDPDLRVTQQHRDGLELTLVGYAVDPSRPTATDDDLLRVLSDQTGRARDVPRHTHAWGGRWVLVAVDATDGILLTDPLGLREVVHTRGGATVCGSQAHVLARALGLEVDPDTRARFLESSYVTQDPEYAWPGDRTPYAELAHLTPNHVLDLDSMQTTRFWPVEDLPEQPAGAVAERAADLLTGLVKAAHHRFDLALPITAGYDSRFAMAATRDIASDVYYYTFQPSTMPDEHQDLVVARQLLDLAGQPHHVVPCAPEPDPAFWDGYAESVQPAHRGAAALADGLWRGFPQGLVSISGHGGEVVRCFGHNGRGRVPTDGAGLTGRSRMGQLEYADEANADWLARARTTEGVELLDLWYWEHRIGRWAANGQAQWDGVHERFTPFNSRELLSTMLSAPIRYRRGPDYQLNRMVMRVLWPDLLDVPVNPDATRSLVRRARSSLSRVRTRVGR